MPLHPCADARRLAETEERMKVLEKEHTEFFDRWHDERRKCEALESVLATVRREMDAQDVLFELWGMVDSVLTPNV